jgi:intracellular septation protein
MHKNVLISWSIEFGPIISFFVSINILGSEDKGFLVSTAVFIIAMILALFSSYRYEGRIAWFPLIAGVSVISFGTLALIFKAPIIFILKDTFYNGFFALLLLVGAVYNKALLKPLFKTLFDMSDTGWYKLSIRWGIFFAMLTI